MKSGSTGYLSITLNNLDLATVANIIFTMKTRSNTVTKEYPGAVTYDEDRFLIPLDQHETTALTGYFETEAQINHIDGSVSKSERTQSLMKDTLATQFLDDATAVDVFSDINLNVDQIQIVSVGGGGTVNAYTKAESDARYAKKTDLAAKANADDVYTKSEIDDKLDALPKEEPDLSDYYTKQEVDDKLDALLKEEPDLTGYYTKTETDAAIAAYWEAHKDELGDKGLTEDEVKAVIAQYLIDNPQGVTPDEIAAAVDDYLTRNPVSGVTTEDITNAVNGYLEAHPDQFKGEKGDDGYTPVKGVDYFDGEDGRTPVKGIDYFDGEKGEPGEPGQNATPEQIAEAVATYLEQNPVSGTVTPEQIASAVEAYLTEHPISGVTDEQIAAAVVEYITAHPDEFRGETGFSGVEVSETEPTDPNVNVWINPKGIASGKTEDAKTFPKVFFSGNLDGMSKDVSKVLKIEYKDGVNDFTAYADMKWQGNSSLSYAKKNFTIKLYEDEAKTIKKKVDLGFGKQTKYCLKANWIDHTHARNVVTARLWGDVVASRENQTEIPAEMLNAPNYGAIDGYPFKLYLNGVYQGLYTWNIPKDGWMFNMSSDNPNHCVLCAEGNNDGNMSRVYSTQFRRTTNFAEDTDGEWTIEFPDVASDDVKASFNRLLTFVSTSTDEDFKANLGNYANVQSLIDYYIFCYLDCGLDGLAQNMIMATYDGVHWFASMYDLDSTWGLWWNGTKFVAATYRCPEDYQENNSLLWQRMEALFADELKTRYTELRNGALSVTNIITRFEGFTDLISNDLYEEDGLVYSGIPNRTNNNIRQIRQYVVDRCAYVDGEFASMGEVATLTSITATKTKTTYTVGEAYSTDDITVRATYSDGTSRNVTEFSIDGDVSTDSEGVTVITISYTEGEITKTADITITVVASGSEPSEPTDVTLIEALNLGGTKYVNTEYVPNYTSKVECLFDSVYGAWGTIFGADNFIKYQWRQSASNGISANVKGTTKTCATNLPSEIYDVIATIDLPNFTVIYASGETVNNLTNINGGQSDTTFPLLIGAGWYQNAIEAPSGIHTIKEFKIYENDVLIKDFKPATKNGVEGMYDTISGTFCPAVTYGA